MNKLDFYFRDVDDGAVITTLDDLNVRLAEDHTVAVHHTQTDEAYFAFSFPVAQNVNYKATVMVHEIPARNLEQVAN